MGDRAQVHIKDEKVWLYTHWNGYKLVEQVQEALSRGKERWDDSEYLARIIFDHMVGNDQGGLAGFGISGNGKHGDVFLVIEIDCENQKVIVRNGEETTSNETFSEFVINH